MKQAAEFFRLFSDPTRYRILHALAQGEFCVCELVDALQTPQYTVSRHLAGMRKGGWVSERRDGTWIYYQLAREHRGLIKSVLRVADKHGLSDALIEAGRMRLDARLKLRVGGRCILGYGEI